MGADLRVHETQPPMSYTPTEPPTTRLYRPYARLSI